MAKTVSLVLGSGGARGYAHIGVIDELLARGYEIVAIAGCSMGALVGGLYASGCLELYREWVLALRYQDVIRLLDISFRSSGLLSSSRVLEAMERMIGDRQIETLPIPYTAVATDLNARKEIWFQKGSLLHAIKASIAIPMLFKPVEYNGSLLVDGGVLNPIPVAPTISVHADLTIAVNLNADIPPLQVSGDSDAAGKGKRVLGQWVRKIKNEGQEKVVESVERAMDPARGRAGILGVAKQSLEVMQEVLMKHQMASYHADILIPIPAKQCRFYEFHRAVDLIKVGRLQAATWLDNYPQFAVTQEQEEACDSYSDETVLDT